jgi:hypothetical protein
MKITIIGLCAAILACFAIYKTIIDLKKENIGYRAGLMWIAIWGSICLFSIFPDLLNMTMELARFHHRTFFVIIIAVFVLYALIFNQAFQIDGMNRDIRKLVREIAILNYKLEQKEQNESVEKRNQQE